MFQRHTRMSSTTLVTYRGEKAGIVPVEQDEGRQASEKQSSMFPRLMSDRLLQVIVVLMVVFFAPLSFTYFLDKTHTSNWNDKVLAVLISEEFSYGKDSGNIAADGQMRILLRNINGMFPHSISGSVAIVVGLSQFNRDFQFRYPVIHRNLGRLYFLCAIIICLSSTSFLIDAIPTKEVFSREIFALILSLLTLGVFITMPCAVYAIWHGDISSHREFMALNYSLMLSAPMLRVCWIAVGRFWGTKYLVNQYGAVFSGPFLLAAPMFYLRQRYSRPMNTVLISSQLRLAVISSGFRSFVFDSQLARFQPMVSSNGSYFVNRTTVDLSGYKLHDSCPDRETPWRFTLLHSVDNLSKRANFWSCMGGYYLLYQPRLIGLPSRNPRIVHTCWRMGRWLVFLIHGSRVCYLNFCELSLSKEQS